MGNHRGLTVLGIALVLSGCATPSVDQTPLRITPKSEVASSPVVRQALPSPARPAVASPAPTAAEASAKTAAVPVTPTLAHVAPALTAPAPPVAVPPLVPPGTLYVCTATVDGQVRQTAIEFEPRVRQLCSKHPEMGVCQYEREACRASGGRVHTAAGVEITRRTEAEYDRKILRVRFRAG